MQYTDLFRRFGSPSSTAEHRIYIYVETSESLKTGKEIMYRDRSAAQNIAEMEKYIELLKLTASNASWRTEPRPSLCGRLSPAKNGTKPLPVLMNFARNTTVCQPSRILSAALGSDHHRACRGPCTRQKEHRIMTIKTLTYIYELLKAGAAQAENARKIARDAYLTAEENEAESASELFSVYEIARNSAYEAANALNEFEEKDW